jgi:hypothetical protein
MSDGTYSKWSIFRTQLTFENVPHSVYDLFKNGSISAISLSLELFEFQNCQYPSEVYSNQVLVGKDSFLYANQLELPSNKLND